MLLQLIRSFDEPSKGNVKARGINNAVSADVIERKQLPRVSPCFDHTIIIRVLWMQTNSWILCVQGVQAVSAILLSCPGSQPRTWRRSVKVLLCAVVDEPCCFDVDKTPTARTASATTVYRVCLLNILPTSGLQSMESLMDFV